MARTKKELEKFSNNLQKLSDNLNNITNNVDEINNQFEDYNEQINDIKDNVKSLESELKEFMHEVKVTPIIEKAKKEIIKDKEELDKKYNKHNLIRERLFNIINNIKNGKYKEYLLTKDEENNFNIQNYYLSYILFAINDWMNNKNTANDKIKEALLLDKERTTLLLTLINIKMNNEKSSSKWLNDYLDTINPVNTNDYLVKLIDYVKHNETLLNIIINKLNEWKSNIEDNSLNNIYDNIKTFINIKNVNDSDYPYLYNYSNEFNDVLDELYSSNIFNDFYIKINNSLNSKVKEFDFLHNLIYSEERYENELITHILENEYIIKNNGKTKKYTKLENKDIFSIFLFSLNNKNINKETKLILIKYLKEYILNFLHNFDTNEVNDINIKIDKWESITKDGSNELELINNLTEFIKKPFDEENNSLTLINYKTIYSFFFILIGIMVTFFYSIIGISMIIVGFITLIFFIYSIDLQKKNNIKLYNETLNQYKDELYNLLSEIVDIKLEINNNLKNKELLLELLDSIN